ncbi:MAG: hypothetical protein CVV24_06925 [Ignavibacteriae bacterium HGW-Ignavibacteriae-3]|nr:MAG: hypothetical protein CVV24_06925 [Ignavibacteriae bacterium HGW-Ignavibacteriae-3]
MKLKLINFILLSGLLFFYSKLSAQEEPLACAEENSVDSEIFVDNPKFITYAHPSSFDWSDPITKMPQDFLAFSKHAFSKDNFPTLASLTFLTTLLIATDHESIYSLRKEYRSSRTFHDIAKKTTYLGDGEFHLGMAALFGGAGLIFKDNRALRTAVQIVEAELVTGITVQILKRITGRESPQSASINGGKFRPFPNLGDYHRDQPKYYSYPSGHVSTSMAVLTVIAENYPEIKWIKPVGYSLVGLIGVGLAARGWHWLSDYPLAVALGYTFGKVITERNIPDPADDDHEYGISFQPVMKNGPGFGLVYKF